jgi:arginine decarboxylase
MPVLLPKKLFLTKGVGKHKERLESFEYALRDAGISSYNLVSLSGKFPSDCKLVSRSEGIRDMSLGQILLVAAGRISTNEPNRLIASSVGVAIPQGGASYGYLAAHESYGETEEKAGEYAEDLAASMYASTLGITFNADQSYDEKQQLWEISGKKVKTRHIVQSAEGDKSGLWTTVVAAAVLLT